MSADNEMPEDHVRLGQIGADSIDASNEIERIKQKYPNGGPWGKDPSAYPGQSKNPTGTGATDQPGQGQAAEDHATQPTDEGRTTSTD
jgi:hypothetical protein